MLPVPEFSRRIPTRLLSCLASILVVCTAAGARADDQAPPAAEAAIRANVDAFVKAYNARDAKAIAGLFTPEGQLLDENDHTTHGRDAIEQAFASVFAASPQGHIEVHVGSIRLFGSALAVETGTTHVTDRPGAEPDVTRYTVVHTKSLDGKWQMAFARDTSLTQEGDAAAASEPAAGAAVPGGNGGAQPANFERLKPLSWLVGNWIDEGDESVVISSCKWSADKNFLLQNIEVRREGRDVLNVHQRIGWDPVARRIRAWLFDSDGGYGESIWTQVGDHWQLTATGVRPDGTRSSSLNLLTPTGKDSYTWQSTNRVVGSQKLPPIEVKVVRKPPEPTK
ncbi:MAG TPA: SgcJ/EcaC family oxidoreductase [Planctomycetaceae bacterium]|jgi:uncharacterized protein (TIGR02246 family)|nr:SgcJ/EcaC family oxidoreductase [Planctomycetaceae bacterium]